MIIRPANVIGARGRHGLIWDLIHKLKNDQTKLEILGNGRQSKSFIHISDTIEGIFHIINNTKEKIEIFNIGTEDSIEIMNVAKIVCKNMNLENIVIHTKEKEEGGIGWKGDIKKAHLDIKKLKSLGWNVNLSSITSADLTSQEIIREEI